MGACDLYYDELRFDTRDPETTHVYMFIRAEGDCPHTLHGWHHKAFPRSITTMDIYLSIADGTEDTMLWESGAPQAQPLVTVFNPHEYVPVGADQLMDWRDNLLGANELHPIEIADAITARLSMAPDWHKACPICRAHDMMLQTQRNPPQ